MHAHIQNIHKTRIKWTENNNNENKKFKLNCVYIVCIFGKDGCLYHFNSVSYMYMFTCYNHIHVDVCMVWIERRKNEMKKKKFKMVIALKLEKKDPKKMWTKKKKPTNFLIFRNQHFYFIIFIFSPKHPDSYILFYHQNLNFVFSPFAHKLDKKNFEAKTSVLCFQYQSEKRWE